MIENKTWKEQNIIFHKNNRRGSPRAVKLETMQNHANSFKSYDN